MKFSAYLIEKEKEKEKKVVFKETDGRSAFPENTVNAIKKEITNLAKDLEKEWSGVPALISMAYKNLDVPEPQAFQYDRWAQQKDIIAHATKQMYQARGGNGSWAVTI